MPQGALAKNNALASGIVDNRDRRVGDVLRDEIAPASAMAFVSAYFTIYAYEALRDVLEAAGPLRFLYGDPQGVGTVDPAASEAKAFGLTDDGGIALKQTLAQKPLAKACAAWIERQVDIRTVAQANFLHGKALSRRSPGRHQRGAARQFPTSRGAGLALAACPTSN